MSGRAQLIQRSRQVKRRRAMFQLSGLVLLILFAVGLTIYTLHRPRWRIEDVKIIGVKSLNSLEIESLIKRETDGSYFWLIPKNSRLFYPEKTLIEKVVKEFPRVASIKLNKSGGRLQIDIIERESELSWCVLTEANVNDCYFVDVTGVAFSKAPNFAGRVLFEVHVRGVATSTATSSVLGKVVLLPETLKSIFNQKEAIHKVLADQKIFDRSIITSVELVLPEGYAFNIVSAGAPQEYWQMMTNSKMPPEVLTETLVALFDSGSFEKNVVKSQQPLSYVDARLASKVFFKTLNNHATSTQ